MQARLLKHQLWHKMSTKGLLDYYKYYVCMVKGKKIETTTYVNKINEACTFSEVIKILFIRSVWNQEFYFYFKFF